MDPVRGGGAQRGGAVHQRADRGGGGAGAGCEVALIDQPRRHISGEAPVPLGHRHGLRDAERARAIGQRALRAAGAGDAADDPALRSDERAGDDAGGDIGERRPLGAQRDLGERVQAAAGAGGWCGESGGGRRPRTRDPRAGGSRPAGGAGCDAGGRVGRPGCRQLQRTRRHDPARPLPLRVTGAGRIPGTIGDRRDGGGSRRGRLGDPLAGCGGDRGRFRRPGDDRPLQRPGVGRPPYI